MSHQCHATGCDVAVPPEMFMCKKHWYQLPKILRDDIWRYYRPGQCDDWKISHAYVQAAKRAVRFIADKEGRVPDTRVYDMLDPGSSMASCVECGQPYPRPELDSGEVFCVSCRASKPLKERRSPQGTQ